MFEKGNKICAGRKPWNKGIKCPTIGNALTKGFMGKLSVHHIDYNKLNTIKENCCALCLDCHIKTNTNRQFWTAFFTSLLKEKYNYNYIEVIGGLKN